MQINLHKYIFAHNMHVNTLRLPAFCKWQQIWRQHSPKPWPSGICYWNFVFMPTTQRQQKAWFSSWLFCFVPCWRWDVRLNQHAIPNLHLRPQRFQSTTHKNLCVFLSLCVRVRFQTFWRSSSLWVWKHCRDFKCNASQICWKYFTCAFGKQKLLNCWKREASIFFKALKEWWKAFSAVLCSSFEEESLSSSEDNNSSIQTGWLPLFKRLQKLPAFITTEPWP